MRFIRTHQGRREAAGLVWGVEPICALLSELGLPIAPSTYYDYRHSLEQAESPEGPRRAARGLRPAGARHALRRLRPTEGVAAAEPRRRPGRTLHARAPDAPPRPARCDPRKVKRTAIADRAAKLPTDLAQRRFAPLAPDRLWVADISYVST